MLKLELVKETADATDIFKVYEDDNFIAEVEFFYDFGETLCEIEVLNGSLTEEQEVLIFEDGCVVYRSVHARDQFSEEA